jgi:hypothetical protein
MCISTDPSAVSAVPSSKHMCGIVRYARLFQQCQELVFERHFLVVFGLTPNVSCDPIKLRSTHAERPIPVLPLEYQATFVQESRGICLEEIDCGCQRYCCGQQEENVAVVRHSSCSKKRDPMPARDRRNKGIEAFLKFRWNQIASVFGAIDDVNIIVGVRMTHVSNRRFAKNNMYVPRLRRSGSC